MRKMSEKQWAELDIRRLSIMIRDSKRWDHRYRCRAVEELRMRRDPEVVPPLLEAIKDENELVRANAAEALSERGDSRVTEPLVEQLMNERDDEVREKITYALAKKGDSRVLEPLRKLLAAEFAKDTDWLIAARRFGKDKDRSAVEPLIKALGDKRPDIPTEAATILWEIGDEEGALFADVFAAGKKERIPELASHIETVLGLVNFDSPEIVVKVAEVFDVLGCPKTAEELRESVKDKIKDPEPEDGVPETLKIAPGDSIRVRLWKLANMPHFEIKNRKWFETAAKAVENLEYDKALDILIWEVIWDAFKVSKERMEAINTAKLFGEHISEDKLSKIIEGLKDDSEEIKARELEKFDKKEFVDPERRKIERKGFINRIDEDVMERRVLYARLLGEWGTAEAVEPLIALLEDPDHSVHGPAAKALGKLKDKSAIIPLLKALESRHPIGTCVAEAALALGELGDAIAVEPLISMLGTFSNVPFFDNLVEPFAEALVKLNDPRAVDPLIRLVGHTKDFHRKIALRCLSKMKDEKSRFFAAVFSGEKTDLSRSAGYVSVLRELEKSKNESVSTTAKKTIESIREHAEMMRKYREEYSKRRLKREMESLSKSKKQKQPK